MSQIDQFLEKHWDNYVSFHIDGDEVEDDAFKKAYSSIMTTVKQTDLTFPDESILSAATPSSVTPSITPAKRLTDADLTTLKTLRTITDLKVCRQPSYTPHIF